MFASVRAWAASLGCTTTVHPSSVGRENVFCPWHSALVWDGILGTPGDRNSSFFRSFGFWYAGLPGDGSTVPKEDWPLYSAGSWVGERLSISSDVGLQAMRELLGNPSFVPGPDDEMCVKVVAVGAKSLFDALVAPKILSLLPQPHPSSPPPSPVQPPSPPPVVPPPAGPGLHPLSPASVRAEELRVMLSGFSENLSWGIFDRLRPSGAALSTGWPVLRPFAVEGVRLYRRLRAKLGDTREIPAEDR